MGVSVPIFTSQFFRSSLLQAGEENAHSLSTCMSPHPGIAELDDHAYSPGPALAGSVEG